LTHEEIEELLGAYALDALDANEREEVEEHLRSCPKCRAEVTAFREVTALLGNAIGESPSAPPNNLWDRIAASLQEQPPSLAPVMRPAGWRRFALVVPLGGLAAALILIVGLLAAKVSNLDKQVTSLRNAQSVASVIANPAHLTIRLKSATADWEADVVLLPRGNGYDGYLINPTLPALGPSQTFQLWALASGKVVSIGLLGSHPNGAAIRVEPTMTLLMITAEPLGGTPTPTTPVLVRGSPQVGV